MCASQSHRGLTTRPHPRVRSPHRMPTAMVPRAVVIAHAARGGIAACGPRAGGSATRAEPMAQCCRSRTAAQESRQLALAEGGEHSHPGRGVQAPLATLGSSTRAAELVCPRLLVGALSGHDRERSAHSRRRFVAALGMWCREANHHRTGEAKERSRESQDALVGRVPDRTGHM